MALNKVVRLTGNPKLAKGRLLGQHDGLVVFVTEHRPKTAVGRARVYVSVRLRRDARRWTVAATRTSAHSADVMFEVVRT